MANENGRTGDPPERPSRGGDVAVQTLEDIPARDRLVAFGLKLADHPGEARPVGPKAVGKHDARLVVGCHCHPGSDTLDSATVCQAFDTRIRRTTSLAAATG